MITTCSVVVYQGVHVFRLGKAMQNPITRTSPQCWKIISGCTCCIWYVMAFAVWWVLQVYTMETRKRRRCIKKEATPVSYSTSSSSASEDDGSAFEAADEGMGNLSNNLSLSLEVEESGSSAEVEMPEL